MVDLVLTPAWIVTIIAGIFLTFLVGALVFARGRGGKIVPIFAVIAAIVFVGGLFTAVAAPPTASVANAPSAAAINVQIATTPALPTGCTTNTVTLVVTCDILYNKTSNYFCISAAVLGCSGKVNYLQYLLSLIRTDAINTTYQFPLQVTSIPTSNSLGANPQTYSILGYKPATATSVGQWQAYWGSGTYAGQFSAVNAPSVAQNILPTSVAIGSFKTVTPVALHLSLAGGNSTSAPESFAASLQNYTAYPVTISVGQGTPATLTINFIEIAWTV